jgi:hypothetical protein
LTKSNQSIYHDGTEFAYISRGTANESITWSEIVSRIKITSLERINGQDRVLTPVYHMTQTEIPGQPGWFTFDYMWSEGPQHQDIEAVVAIADENDHYVVEITKLTQHAIRIDIDNGIQSFTIPATTSFGETGLGFISLTLQKISPISALSSDGISN